MNRLVQTLLLPVSVFTLVSCGNTNNQTITNDVSTTAVVENKDTSTADSYTQFKYDMVISNIPFPFEMLDKLIASKAPFNQQSMNPVGNISKYNQFNAKAFNLGVYGADLAYAVTYEQFQQIGSYVKNTKKLAEDLSIPLAFNQEMIDKYTRFKDNKDSLAQVVYDSYSKVDATLKSNERLAMAGLVVTGSWLEGLYLTTKNTGDAAKTDANKDVYTVIWQQKLHLENIIKLLEQFKSDAYFAGLITELNAMLADLEGTEIDQAKLSSLNKKAEKLRNRIIEGL
ncbi:MAG: hypothetical protein J0L87_04980 [Bacteroidetes bacterium]|nr:hypothetical protein [Bacteroidota bacterium]